MGETKKNGANEAARKIIISIENRKVSKLFLFHEHQADSAYLGGRHCVMMMISDQNNDDDDNKENCTMIMLTMTISFF